MTHKVSITIPNSSVTVELDKDEIYWLFAELSQYLNLNDDEHNQHINADGVINEVCNAHGMSDTGTDIAISSFLALDKNIQRSIANDALNGSISLFANAWPPLDHIDDLAENEIDLAAENKIYDIYIDAAHTIIGALR